MSEDLVKELRKEHRPVPEYFGSDRQVCIRDSQRWPCDATRAANELEQQRERLFTGQQLVEAMDRKMPEQATEDEDGWVTSYRIPVGPWHRLLAWSRSFTTGLALSNPKTEEVG